jgi:hypothetical protein
MKHDWDHPNPKPGSKWFKYFGAADLRVCKNCGKHQVKESQTHYMRITGYRWYPLVGRCKGKPDK